MLVGAFGAIGFSLRGRIPMKAAQKNVYPALASRTNITRSSRIPMNRPLTKKRGASRWAPIT